MTLIDQRILIDAPHDVVWKMLIDPRELRGWHAGYTSVSILTTHQTGEGVRRRCGLSATGKDVFEEITAWVEGLGYEYRVVEGGPWRSMTGRFRLQAMPDGTSVQWVIAYQPKGLVGLVRDRLSGRRAMAAMMSESLKELRRRVNTLGVHMDDISRERVGIRGRLDANERAQYQRRYPTPSEAGLGAPVAGTPPAVGTAPGAAPVPSAPFPSFVADLTDGESGQPITKPRKPEGLAEALEAMQGDRPAPVEPPLDPSIEPPVSPEDTPRHGTPAVEGAPPTGGTPAVQGIDDVPPVSASSALPYTTDGGDFTRPEDSPEVIPPDFPSPGILPLGVADDYDDASAFHQQVTPQRGMPAIAADDARAADLPSAPVSEPSVEIPPPAAIAPPMDTPQLPTPAVPGTPATSGPGVPPPAEWGPARRAPDRPAQTPTHDTGEMSIWEVFGMQRPSERDTEALNTLIRSTQSRERAGLRARDAIGGMRRAFRRARRVRVEGRSQAGLRLRLALKAARVRLFWRR